MSNEEEEEGEEESRHRLFLFRALFEKDNDLMIPSPSHDSSVVSANAESIKKRRTYTRVTRIAQLDAWDCGIACLLMIAQWLRNDRDYDKTCFDKRIALERKKILSEVGTQSIWTSDLMMQLHSWKTKTKATNLWYFSSWLKAVILDGNSFEAENDLAFVLASKEIGADETYRDFQYYQNAFEEDQNRVALTFRNLQRQNVAMLQTTTKNNVGKGLSLSTVIEIVEREDCLAIVLLDNNVFSKGDTGQNNDLDDGRSKTNRRHYSGHYVILCGTSDDPKHVEIARSQSSLEETPQDEISHDGEFCFVVCNPDPSFTRVGSNYAFFTPRQLEAAWRAEGTDEDIIFLRKIPMSKFKT